MLAVLAAFGVPGAMASGAADVPPAPSARAPAPALGGQGPLLVRRGEIATLSASQGGVVVESPVEVLQDGKAGQRVLVRGNAWSVPLAARVTGPGAVEPAR